MNKYSLVALSVAGGILSGLAWTSWCSGIILLFSFVPFFIIENHLFENQHRYSSNDYFIYVLPGILIFTILGIGWMRVATIAGATGVILGLSFLMSFTLWLAHTVRIRAGDIPGYLSIITFWLAFEFLSLNINIVTPWLNLGNGLSKDILLIQWYDTTGTAGGSLWILLSNILLSFVLLSYRSDKRKFRAYLVIWIGVILLPSAFSIIRYYTIRQNYEAPYEVLLIQPNTDPYTEKFTVPFEEQLKKTLKMAVEKVSEKTIWIITPETTVDDPVNIDDLNNNVYIRMIKELAIQNPKTSIIAGLVTFRKYPPMENPPTGSARKINISGLYYDHFNSALRIDTGAQFEIYHKSKLVPGIEMQFSKGPGRLIAKILPYLGGTGWGYGIQEERICFEHPGTSHKIAPVICYESVFGEFLSEYIKKGAEAIFIITNDGWWKNTKGYQQHLSYASVRAIETRRQVARTANTGVSCIIDIRGKRIIETGWWTPATIKGEIVPEHRITPYVKYGDYILRIASFLSIVILIIIFIAIPVRDKLK